MPILRYHDERSTFLGHHTLTMMAKEKIFRYHPWSFHLQYQQEQRFLTRRP